MALLLFNLVAFKARSPGLVCAHGALKSKSWTACAFGGGVHGWFRLTSRPRICNTRTALASTVLERSTDLSIRSGQFRLRHTWPPQRTRSRPAAFISSVSSDDISQSRKVGIESMKFRRTSRCGPCFVPSRRVAPVAAFQCRYLGCKTCSVREIQRFLTLDRMFPAVWLTNSGNIPVSIDGFSSASVSCHEV